MCCFFLNKLRIQYFILQIVKVLRFRSRAVQNCILQCIVYIKFVIVVIHNGTEMNLIFQTFFAEAFLEKEISTLVLQKKIVNFTASQTHFSENGISPINFLLHFKSSFSLYLIFIVLHNFQLYH